MLLEGIFQSCEHFLVLKRFFGRLDNTEQTATGRVQTPGYCGEDQLSPSGTRQDRFIKYNSSVCVLVSSMKGKTVPHSVLVI